MDDKPIKGYTAIHEGQNVRWNGALVPGPIFDQAMKYALSHFRSDGASYEQLEYGFLLGYLRHGPQAQAQEERAANIVRAVKQYQGTLTERIHFVHVERENPNSSKYVMTTCSLPPNREQKNERTNTV